jgi:hypothetical protein
MRTHGNWQSSGSTLPERQVYHGQSGNGKENLPYGKAKRGPNGHSGPESLVRAMRCKRSFLAGGNANELPAVFTPDLPGHAGARTKMSKGAS